MESLLKDYEEAQVENVKVFLRVKPLALEECIGQMNIVNTRTINVIARNVTKDFTFDQVFNEQATQLKIYQNVASPLVERVLNGYNATIFAYGQSGTGKTFTILGNAKKLENRGLIPNIMSDMLQEISSAGSDTSYLITVTFLEIYNEKIKDLLNNNTKENLEVRENPELGVYVKNLIGITVECSEQILEIINEASKNRSIGSTLLNEQSSRSHTIFTIRIEAKHQDGSTTLGKLNLVDLAGSERVSKSFASGDRLKEAVKINLSLSVLGNVISALVDRKSTYIPYRNSKLTRLLQDSLGGNCMTSMIATISQNIEHFEESYYTLMYVSRAKLIKNNVKRNEETRQGVLSTFEDKLRDLQRQLEELDKKPLAAEKPLRREKRVNNLYDAELEATENEKKSLADKIMILQKKILVGGENLIKKAHLQEEIMKNCDLQLRQLDSSHQILQEALENKTMQKINFERNSLSLQEEDCLLDIQIEEIERKINKAQKVLYAKEAEYQNEISNMLYTNKSLARDLNLADLVLVKTMDKQHLNTVNRNIIWDEDLQEFRVKCVAHCGNNLNKINLGFNDNNTTVTRKMKRCYKKYPLVL